MRVVKGNDKRGDKRFTLTNEDKTLDYFTIL
ncbi:hypothetical protein [Enterococcus phage vB_EfaP_Efmus2]|uniref:Uncharacterized protein n=1 Tax=Enterococcus phage vB_EfaP_Efmus2 TaxID=2546624 RepID=A0A4D6DTK1_9CAUD|nr:hypothetical protein [Enterococcus phage vB_EfaP_Efmus2]